MSHYRKLVRLPAIVATVAAMLVLAACGSDSNGNASEGDDPASKDPISIAVIQGWTDSTSTAYLWKHVLEDKGYKVEIKELSDAAPLYVGMSQGDIDLYTSAWPEVTHKAYMEKYGDDLEDLDTYYEGAKLFLAVPDYTPVDSIDQLNDNADLFDGTITGIEAGAGLTRATKDDVMPAYGLNENYKLVTSSTAAMLTQLKKATENKQDILVTLWKPFWANGSFPVKALEDPKGAFGESEGLHILAHKGFSDEYPEVAEMMGRLKLSDDQYSSLEDTVVNKFGQGKEPEAIDAWFKENPDILKTIVG